MLSVDIKRDYGFIEYEDPKQAKEAVDKADGTELEGHKLLVQMASAKKDRAHGPSGNDVCFNCGMRGHWY